MHEHSLARASRFRHAGGRLNFALRGPLALALWLLGAACLAQTLPAQTPPASTPAAQSPIAPLPGTVTPGPITPRGVIPPNSAAATTGVPTTGVPLLGGFQRVWTREQIPVASCSTPPRIDGVLNDPAWRTATHATQFFRRRGDAPVVQQTQAWLCADRTHLYVAFRCLDSHPNRIQAAQTQRDGDLSHDDYVEIDIDSQDSHRGESRFLVSARGTQQEFLEGGTADNITWAGDWQAAARRTAHGWDAEMAIPFALLRYPRGAHTFGLLLQRKIAREPIPECWPYLPPNGDQAETQYMDQFTGLSLPFFAPRPIFLPYVLATAGAGEAARAGMDIKYPLTTTLTGVATLFPDFQTVEQDVTSINFSYTEKYQSDHRPFFAEGSGFLPSSNLFYSRRISTVDAGLKVVGKEGDTSIGALATDARGMTGQRAGVLQVRQDIGLYSHALIDWVGDSQPGQPSGEAAKLEGQYGWQVGRDNYSTLFVHSPSWQGGIVRDSRDYTNFSYNPPPGHLGFSADYTDIGPQYISDLGFVPEVNLRGSSVNVNQYNQFERGQLESYNFGGGASTYQHHTGGFFHKDLYAYGSVSNHAGSGVGLNWDQSQRDSFHDHTEGGSLFWGHKTLYQSGGTSDTFGQQAGQPYNFFSFGQGILVSRPFSLELNYSRLRLGSVVSTQAIATGTYRLSATQALGARIVNQGGADQGGGLGTNIYLSFSQQVRSGTDLFVLLGDPNSPRTRGLVTVKVVSPF